MRNIFHTLLRLAVSFLWLDIPYYAAFWGAIRRLGPAMQLRKTVKAHLLLRDAEILQRTAGVAR